MARAHEALDDSMSQAKLATDRVGTFMEDRLSGPGVLHRLARHLPWKS